MVQLRRVGPSASYFRAEYAESLPTGLPEGKSPRIPLHESLNLAIHPLDHGLPHS